MSTVITTPIDRQTETVTIRQEPGTIISMIARAASDPAVSIDKMERLFEMHEKMEVARKQSAYHAAMAAAQAEIGAISRDRKNEHTKSAYATLEAIDEAIRPIYTKHGFSLSFDSADAEGGRIVHCDILHSDGHRERKTLKGALDTVGPNGTRNKTDIQGLGSTVSYLRRYLTCMVFNIAIKNEDMDGNKAKDNGATITAGQYDQLTKWLDEVEGDPDKFAAILGASELRFLPSRQYANAVNQLKARATKLGVALSQEAANAS